MANKGTVVKVKYTLKVDGIELEKSDVPAVIAVGKNHVLKGFDEALQTAEIGKEVHVEIPPEKAYGQRNPELVRLVSIEVFKRQAIDPVPGMPVELDGLPARVQSVSGGRVRVDFNHDLAGKTIVYDFTILEELKTPLSTISAIAEQHLDKGASCSFDEATKTAVVNVDSKSCLKQGYGLAKSRVLSTILSFVEGVETVKFTEEYRKESVAPDSQNP